MNTPVTVLFLCTGNSARSILAESLLNRLGIGRFKAYSAGSQPKGEVHPLALRTLQAHGFPLDGLRSKSWDEFEPADAPSMDIIVTVCDNAAGETCPIWPGHPIRAHWGIDDPAAATGTEAQRLDAFALAFERMKRRIERFLALPWQSLDRDALIARVSEIGEIDRD